MRHVFPGCSGSYSGTVVWVMLRSSMNSSSGVPAPSGSGAGWYMISWITTGPTFTEALAAPLPFRKAATEEGLFTPNVGLARAVN